MVAILERIPGEDSTTVVGIKCVGGGGGGTVARAVESAAEMASAVAGAADIAGVPKPPKGPGAGTRPTSPAKTISST